MGLLKVLLGIDKEIPSGTGATKVQFKYKPIIGEIREISGRGLVEEMQFM